MATPRIENWKTLNSKLVLDNKWAKVRKDICVLPDGHQIDDYYYWEGGDFAQVFALTSEREIVLVRQYKHGVKEIVLELPAGMIDDNETALDAAQRELREETGFEATNWKSLGTLNVSSAKSTTRAFPFLATDARRTRDPQPDEHEVIEVTLVPVDGILRRITAGEISDSNSIAVVLLALTSLGFCHQSE